MTFDQFPEEIILEILSYIENDKDRLSFSCVNKYTRSIMKENSCFRRKLEISPFTHFSDYIKRCELSENSLKQLTINRLPNPNVWIVSLNWPEIICIKDCTIGDQYFFGPEDSGNHKTKSILVSNTEKFTVKNLGSLEKIITLLD